MHGALGVQEVRSLEELHGLLDFPSLAQDEACAVRGKRSAVQRPGLRCRHLLTFDVQGMLRQAPRRMQLLLDQLQALVEGLAHVELVNEPVPLLEARRGCHSCHGWRTP